jgi:hypothetical protein
MTGEVKMTESAQTGLVGRMMELLSDLPALPAIGDLRAHPAPNGATPSAAERRVRLALRIALMKRGDIAAPAPVQEDPEPEAPDPLPEPEPEPEPEKEIIPPTPAKPPRVSMSTVRLEDAAFLLNAFSAPKEAEGDPASPAAASRSAAAEPSVSADQTAKASQSSGHSDIADLAATFAAMDPSGAEDEAPPTEYPAKDTADPAPPSPKKGRKARTAVADIAGAAAAMAALQDMGTETPEPEQADTPPDPR